MIEQYIEALIFASETSIKTDEIIQCLKNGIDQEISRDDLLTSINNIQNRYNDGFHALELANIGGGYQFITKSAMQPVVQQLQVQRSKKKLSQSALETLSIIAYKQPITKIEIEKIRGVNCDYTIQKLLEKDFISIKGKAQGPGRPLLYALSPFFLDYFGINSVSDLPQLKDLESFNANEIGEKTD